ncbi:hypothetical protein BESB_043800 [Besnoitia besnoiti]|uniref:KH domain-containing protein n=1 Tax=Besnoitia besnoiti TaxID=94643 RepID=A0A2A9MCH3_BESBE|nr:hypothetical protein BESB_043800 [Besnoitia besnoiti]PFH36188.1 hypothetical protein BESB_043800 [Besnoitia besnoiti]
MSLAPPAAQQLSPLVFCEAASSSPYASSLCDTQAPQTSGVLLEAPVSRLSPETEGLAPSLAPAPHVAGGPLSGGGDSAQAPLTDPAQASRSGSLSSAAVSAPSPCQRRTYHSSQERTRGCTALHRARAAENVGLRPPFRAESDLHTRREAHEKAPTHPCRESRAGDKSRAAMGIAQKPASVSLASSPLPAGSDTQEGPSVASAENESRPASAASLSSPSGDNPMKEKGGEGQISAPSALAPSVAALAGSASVTPMPFSPSPPSLPPAPKADIPSAATSPAPAASPSLASLPSGNFTQLSRGCESVSSMSTVPSFSRGQSCASNSAEAGRLSTSFPSLRHAGDGVSSSSFASLSSSFSFPCAVPEDSAGAAATTGGSEGAGKAEARRPAAAAVLLGVQAGVSAARPPRELHEGSSAAPSFCSSFPPAGACAVQLSAQQEGGRSDPLPFLPPEPAGERAFAAVGVHASHCLSSSQSGSAPPALLAEAFPAAMGGGGSLLTACKAEKEKPFGVAPPIQQSPASASSAQPAATTLCVCKFLLGEDVAGYLVGRKGGGIDEFQKRNGPGLRVTVSKRGEIFPVLGERIAAAVGVQESIARALDEIVDVATKRAMHKEEERRLDTGRKISKPKTCFKLVVPETSVRLLEQLDDTCESAREIGRKYRTEVLLTSANDWFHLEAGDAVAKERLVQVIGLPNDVKDTVRELVPLYQQDATLTTSLELCYGKKTPAPPPPPPPIHPPLFSFTPSPTCSPAFPGNNVPPPAGFSSGSSFLPAYAGSQLLFSAANNSSALCAGGTGSRGLAATGGRGAGLGVGVGALSAQTGAGCSQAGQGTTASPGAAKSLLSAAATASHAGFPAAPAASMKPPLYSPLLCATLSHAPACASSYSTSAGSSFDSFATASSSSGRRGRRFSADVSEIFTRSLSAAASSAAHPGRQDPAADNGAPPGAGGAGAGKLGGGGAPNFTAELLSLLAMQGTSRGKLLPPVSGGGSTGVPAAYAARSLALYNAQQAALAGGGFGFAAKTAGLPSSALSSPFPQSSALAGAKQAPGGRFSSASSESAGGTPPDALVSAAAAATPATQAALVRALLQQFIETELKRSGASAGGGEERKREGVPLSGGSPTSDHSGRDEGLNLQTLLGASLRGEGLRQELLASAADSAAQRGPYAHGFLGGPPPGGGIMEAGTAGAALAGNAPDTGATGTSSRGAGGELLGAVGAQLLGADACKYLYSPAPGLKGHPSVFADPLALHQGNGVHATGFPSPSFGVIGASALSLSAGKVPASCLSHGEERSAGGSARQGKEDKVAQNEKSPSGAAAFPAVAKKKPPPAASPVGGGGSASLFSSSLSSLLDPAAPVFHPQQSSSSGKSFLQVIADDSSRQLLNTLLHASLSPNGAQACRPPGGAGEAVAARRTDSGAQAGASSSVLSSSFASSGFPCPLSGAAFSSSHGLLKKPHEQASAQHQARQLLASALLTSDFGQTDASAEDASQRQLRNELLLLLRQKENLPSFADELELRKRRGSASGSALPSLASSSSSRRDSRLAQLAGPAAGGDCPPGRTAGTREAAAAGDRLEKPRLEAELLMLQSLLSQHTSLCLPSSAWSSAVGGGGGAGAAPPVDASLKQLLASSHALPRLQQIHHPGSFSSVNSFGVWSGDGDRMDEEDGGAPARAPGILQASATPPACRSVEERREGGKQRHDERESPRGAPLSSLSASSHSKSPESVSSASSSVAAGLRHSNTASSGRPGNLEQQARASPRLPSSETRPASSATASPPGAFSPASSLCASFSSAAGGGGLLGSARPRGGETQRESEGPLVSRREAECEGGAPAGPLASCWSLKEAFSFPQPQSGAVSRTSASTPSNRHAPLGLQPASLLLGLRGGENVGESKLGDSAERPVPLDLSDRRREAREEGSRGDERPGSGAAAGADGAAGVVLAAVPQKRESAPAVFCCEGPQGAQKSAAMPPRAQSSSLGHSGESLKAASHAANGGDGRATTGEEQGPGAAADSGARREASASNGRGRPGDGESGKRAAPEVKCVSSAAAGVEKGDLKPPAGERTGGGSAGSPQRDAQDASEAGAEDFSVQVQVPVSLAQSEDSLSVLLLLLRSFSTRVSVVVPSSSSQHTTPPTGPSRTGGQAAAGPGGRGHAEPLPGTISLQISGSADNVSSATAVLQSLLAGSL